jgi:hypothetical protein
VSVRFVKLKTRVKTVVSKAIRRETRTIAVLLGAMIALTTDAMREEPLRHLRQEAVRMRHRDLMSARRHLGLRSRKIRPSKVLLQQHKAKHQVQEQRTQQRVHHAQRLDKAINQSNGKERRQQNDKEIGKRGTPGRLTVAVRPGLETVGQCPEITGVRVTATAKRTRDSGAVHLGTIDPGLRRVQTDVLHKAVAIQTDAAVVRDPITVALEAMVKVVGRHAAAEMVAAITAVVVVTVATVVTVRAAVDTRVVPMGIARLVGVPADKDKVMAAEVARAEPVKDKVTAAVQVAVAVKDKDMEAVQVAVKAKATAAVQAAVAVKAKATEVVQAAVVVKAKATEAVQAVVVAVRKAAWEVVLQPVAGAGLLHLQHLHQSR